MSEGGGAGGRQRRREGVEGGSGDRDTDAGAGG